MVVETPRSVAAARTVTSPRSRRSMTSLRRPRRGSFGSVMPWVMGIGVMHGAAGSAALLVLTVAATQSIGQALGYFAVFGLGSIIGMAALSAVASFPLMALDRGARWMQTASGLGIGGLAIWVGGSLALRSLPGVL